MPFPCEALPYVIPADFAPHKSELDSKMVSTALVLLGLCGEGEIGMSNGNREMDRGGYGASLVEEDERIDSELWSSGNQSTGQESEENGGRDGCGASFSYTDLLNHGGSPIYESNGLFSQQPVLYATPICRQFWKAGNYETGEVQGIKPSILDGRNHLNVHPMFLHSNATSHKWVFGAIAELVDNAVDEIQNGATFVAIDKVSNPCDGSPALLIQDDGSGMDPGAIRNCMSFGFSDKKMKQAIGQYGNGFKTSSMRLGMDVIVFSRHINMRTFTQSVGLLSFTLLKQMNYERIVVPTVDYEFNTSTGSLERLLEHGNERFLTSLSVLLKWSPYRTEEELLRQFDDIGYHGTKVVVYNLWPSEDGDLELDLNSDPEDILINGYHKLFGSDVRRKFDQHIVYRYQYSLQAYLSILYLRMPQSFNIFLCGRVVEHHNLADDLKHPEFILYKPQTGHEAVVTTIGFLKEAPSLNINGFSIYHRNRLILPFWKVVKNRGGSVGRGVVGILEVNYIEPTHNKQDFEKTSLFHRLEERLKQMTLEYWHLHCDLLGCYKKRRRTGRCLEHPSTSTHGYSVSASFKASLRTLNDPVVPRRKRSTADVYETRTQQGQSVTKEEQIPPGFVEHLGRCTGALPLSFVTDNRFLEGVQHQTNIGNQAMDTERILVVQEYRRLKLLVFEAEKREKQLTMKVEQLLTELKDVYQKNQISRIRAKKHCKSS